MIIYEDKLTAQEFVDLIEAVGWGKTNLEQIEIALENTIYSVSVEIDGKIIGMGRVIGDGARVFYIQDVVIHPDYQGIGIGTKIMEKLIAYIKKVKLYDCNIMVGLMSAKDKECFYERFGFRKRPNDYQGNGMMLNISK
ncbi:MAG: GNAT family N-acetyltransferase [Lachnospiraceae bacterium]|nr:GNAT family N-acetyltransferase [Lachnospiraceae bacterium]